MLQATDPILSAMRNFADYNLWANTTMINWLKTKPEALLEQEVLSSFKGIRATLVHIWHTQCYWLSVINHTTFTPEEYTGSTEALFDHIIDQSAATAAYVNEMSRDTMEDSTLITNPWFECNYPNFEYIIQCMNHSTYHRGQIVTIGHHLGFTDAPMTDYNFYNVATKAGTLKSAE